jgi:hypothetical protein
MKIKYVTAYWMDVDGYPFQGSIAARKDRYLGSLISHCKNLGREIICYTHKKSLHELENLKELHNLENLTIKILELTDMKLHKGIHKCREIFFDTDLDGRGSEIMWGKFDVLERELDGTEQIFWLDVGLQHPGIFPWMYCTPYHDRSFHDLSDGRPPYWTHIQQTQYDFGLIFNKKLMDKLQEITKNKIFFISTNNPQTSYGQWQLHNIIDYDVYRGPYLIAGMFGGNSNILKQFINKFWFFANKAIENNFLVTEESIMKVVYDSLEKDIFLTFDFSTHQSGTNIDYHFEIWKDDKDGPKPLYMIWHDILNFK